MAPTRREFLGAACIGTAAACFHHDDPARREAHSETSQTPVVTPRVVPQDGSTQEASTQPRPPAQRFPLGYLLVQDLKTGVTDKFGAMASVEQGKAMFGQLAGKLDGVEYQTGVYAEQALATHEAIARVGNDQGIDLWASTWKFWQKAKAFGPIRKEFQAHVMEPDGSIGPAMTDSGKDSVPLLDVLNPEAMEWAVGEFGTRYFDRMKGLLSGLFFNEDIVPYLAKPVHENRPDYWRNATFSPRVLQLWRDYCRTHGVQSGGKLVDCFPVHDPAMVANGSGLTMHVPTSATMRIEPGQHLMRLARAEGVWQHWEDFVAGQFLDNWIVRLARRANEANRGQARWKGVIYFGLQNWSLPYEELAGDVTVPQKQHWGAWGKQHGLDLAKLAALPEIDCVICETYPPVEANLEQFVAEYARITRQAGKTFGVMLHRDDKWALDPNEEAARWAIIDKIKPTVIARYPLTHMLPSDGAYNAQGEALFESKLKQYRQKG